MPEGAASSALARNAAVTSAAQLAAMAAGGVLAVLVAILVGSDARTDGFFAAYGIYSLGVLFAQSARGTVVARLVESETRFGGFDRFLGGALVIVALVAVLFVPLGGLLASLVTGDLPGEAQDTARTALLLLLPAMAGQIFAGLGAAMLGALGDFVWPGIAFAGGGFTSILAFAALEPLWSIDALGAGLLVGAAVSAGVVGVRLAVLGWRPSRALLRAPRAMASSARVLVVASLAQLVAHLGYVATLAVAARLGEGVVTSLTYAYLGFTLVHALVAGSIPLVLAAPLAERWDRRPEGLAEPLEQVFRAGMLVLLPIVAAVVLVGHEVGGVLLARFTAPEVDLTVDLFLFVVPLVAFGLVQAVAYSGIMVLGRYREVALLSLAVVVVQLALVLAAGAADRPRLLGLAFPLAGVLNLVGTLLLVSRGFPRLVLPRVARAVVPVAVVATAAFAASALVAHAVDAPAADWFALALGLAVYAGGVLALLPVERDLGRRVLASVRPAR